MVTRTVDLDAARAARAEQRGEAPTVIFGGKTFNLPAELPFSMVELVGELAEVQSKNEEGSAAAKIMSSLAQVLFQDQWEEFLALGPSVADIQVLLEGVVPAYGLGLGESQASEG